MNIIRQCFTVYKDNDGNCCRNSNRAEGDRQP